ncbi:hypothetical protein AJ78_00029 [Emergomyces pasteurianus Ep9510]|uniref:Uncharacterized protein n=1 Tax=Emergomyces pasteurianus Ep9510 TaxID=1447872 RepID=A0A1J9QXG5_9EURO|nr:hypothetical protein AJ78_00029 [Emergomyces pasteurianus Ep9510]
MGELAKKYLSTPLYIFLAAITRHDGREVDAYQEIRSMPRTMNMSDLGELGDIAASAVAVDEQAGRVTPEEAAAPAVETKEEEEEAPAAHDQVSSISADTSVSSADEDRGDVNEVVAPGTAR